MEQITLFSIGSLTVAKEKKNKCASLLLARAEMNIIDSKYQNSKEAGERWGEGGRKRRPGQLTGVRGTLPGIFRW